MTDRAPLVVVAGRTKEMPSGDYVAPASLGSGTPDSTTFLRGDKSWAAPTAVVSADMIALLTSYG